MLSQDFGCGETVVSTLTLELHDLIAVDILDDIEDTVIICASAGCIPLEVTGAETYSWFPDTLFNDDTLSMPIICAQESQWIYVEGALGICTDLDSVYVNVIDVEVAIQPDVDNIEICQGETLEVTALNNVNDQNLNWTSFFTNFTDPSNPTQIIDDALGIGFRNQFRSLLKLEDVLPQM